MCYENIIEWENIEENIGENEIGKKFEFSF